MRKQELLDKILYERSGVCHCGNDMDRHSIWDTHYPIEMIRLRPLFQWLVDFYRAYQQFGDGFEGFLKQHYILTVLLITALTACLMLIVKEIMGV